MSVALAAEKPPLGKNFSRRGMRRRNRSASPYRVRENCLALRQRPSVSPVFQNGAITGAFAYAAASAAQRLSDPYDPVFGMRQSEVQGIIDSSPQFVWQPLPQSFVDGAAGIGDAILFGLGDELRAIAGIDGGVNYDSSSYRISGYLGVAALGGGRLAYASAVRGYSIVASSGVAASSFRTAAGNFFRFGARRPYQPNLSRYSSDAALRAAAGRTNPYVNALGAGHVGANIYNLELQAR